MTLTVTGATRRAGTAMALLMLNGCLSAAPPALVHHAPDRSIVRQPCMEGHGSLTGAGADARVRWDEGDWRRLLGAMSVRPRRWTLALGSDPAGTTPAFGESERAYLAHVLAAQFAHLEPGQCLVFFLSSPRESDGREVTSGAFFLRPDGLHVFLANYRYAVTMPLIERQIRAAPLRSASEPFYDMIPDRHLAVHPARDAGQTQSFFSHGVEAVIDHRSMLAGPRRPAGGEPAAAEPGHPPRKRSAPEDALRLLQRLREQGLITEEEYRLKRQAILDEL